MEHRIDLIASYPRFIFTYYFSRFLTGSLIRLLARSLKHEFCLIGKTKVIGNHEFIRSCEEFSKQLERIDRPMYDELFIKNKFVFIQYSDAKYQNIMAGEYAVPLHYQKLKAQGIGALMIYGFFCTTILGRSFSSYIRNRRQRGFARIINEKTYGWLTEHQFPETICKWYRRSLEPAP